MGALGHDGKLLWTIKEQRIMRDEVIAFFDGIAEQSHPVPCIVVLDNANIHHGEVMEQKRRQWQRRGLYLYYLPPYSPELNRIEILGKQAKYFWRKFIRLTAGGYFGPSCPLIPVHRAQPFRSIAPTHSGLSRPV